MRDDPLKDDWHLNGKLAVMCCRWVSRVGGMSGRRNRSRVSDWTLDPDRLAGELGDGRHCADCWSSLKCDGEMRGQVRFEI